MNKLQHGVTLGSGVGRHTDMIGALLAAAKLFTGDDRDRVINAAKTLTMDIVERVENCYVPEEKSYDVTLKHSYDMKYCVVAKSREDAIAQAKATADKTGEDDYEPVVVGVREEV